MKRTLNWLLLLVVVSLASGCASTRKTGSNEQPLPTSVTQILQSTQSKYAPDSRMGIFRVTPEISNDLLVLRGDVEHAQAKQELLEQLREIGLQPVDRINVLPATNLADATWGIVRISVANVRDERGNGAELGTQVLMGHIVRVWKNEGGWFFVQSAADRYVGWTDDDSFVRVTKEQVDQWNATKRVIVTEFEDRVWQQPGGKGRGNHPITDVVAGCLLKKVSEEGDWLKVELPDGRAGYLAKNSVTDFDTWKSTRNPTPENIEETAFSLLGLPYLWGGTSTKGVDCSGFTKTVYFLNGINLLRNASHQAREGTDIPIDPEFKNLRKGDLLFFGSKGSERRPERVSHVGIYLGDKKFIHSSGLVRVNSLDRQSPILDRRRLETLIRVRRYLPEQ